MKATFFSAAACIGILSALSSDAFSQTLTTSSEYGIPIVENVTEIDETGFLALFDSNLGTLTAITLNLYGAGTTEIALTNNSVSTVTAKIIGSSDLFFSSALAPLDAFLQNNNADVALNFPTGGNHVFAPGETKYFGPLSATGSLTYDLSSLISAMQAPGGGNFSLNAQSLNGLTILGGGGNLVSTQTTTAGTGASIQYTYIAVPEPGSAILAVLGAIPLLKRRRTR